MKKHEWRKKEKEYYLPKTQAVVVNVPAFQFVTIAGEGNPNSQLFSECISVLYTISYAIKMTLKKLKRPPSNYSDFTVYPLEGIWDIKEEAKKHFDGMINKDDLVFDLMIRQPNFVDTNFFTEVLELTIKKKPNTLWKNVKFQEITDGKCIQKLHIGSYDNEPVSFKQMEVFAEERGLKRLSKKHREIYLSDFRKVAPEKLKTVLRFQVE